MRPGHITDPRGSTWCEDTPANWRNFERRKADLLSNRRQRLRQQSRSWVSNGLKSGKAA